MLSIQEQVYGASLIWSEAKYNFAFWNVRKNIDWDAEYYKLLNKLTQPMELLDYYLELSRFISLLNDGHTHIDFPREISKGFLALPIKIKNYSGKHIVTNVAAGCTVPIFSVINKINGMDFDTYMNEKIMPYYWNIKPSSVYEIIYPFYWLEGTAAKSIYGLIPIIEKNKDVEFTTSNGMFTLSPCSRNIEWSLPYTLKCGENLKEIFASEGLIISYTDDNIAVIRIPHFMDNSMPANFYKYLDELQNCKGFINRYTQQRRRSVKPCRCVFTGVYKRRISNRKGEASYS